MGKTTRQHSSLDRRIRRRDLHFLVGSAGSIAIHRRMRSARDMCWAVHDLCVVPRTQHHWCSVARSTFLFFMLAPRTNRLGWQIEPKSPHQDDVHFFRRPPWIQRMTQVEVSFIFLCSGFAKLRNKRWRDGTAMYSVFGQVDFHATGVEELIRHHAFWKSLTYVGLVSKSREIRFQGIHTHWSSAPQSGGAYQLSSPGSTASTNRPAATEPALGQQKAGTSTGGRMSYEARQAALELLRNPNGIKPSFARPNAAGRRP
ncbi:hypothetical protein Pla52n_35760 [Stieleria varia]|uniref:Uncharacterized protein n=1 Tax=Stieleria varia TaxID=2528005 RepID=A0A5C6ATZ6_9BACT|nr:hypothetical protein Pla52n_35760 [Stieleria varia]